MVCEGCGDECAACFRVRVRVCEGRVIILPGESVPGGMLVDRERDEDNERQRDGWR